MSTFGHTHTPQLSAPEAVALLEQGAVLLDVREADEWQAGHAPEAVHVPLGELASQVSRIDRSQQIVIICRSGRRSDHATAALRNAGYDAYNFSGGMHAWQQAGGAVLTPSGHPGTVI
jgi:rhodanese-related sulfurtransferase